MLRDRLQNLQLTCCSWCWLNGLQKETSHMSSGFCQDACGCPAPLLCKTPPASLTVCNKYILMFSVVAPCDTYSTLEYPILFQHTILHCGFMATELIIYTHSHRWMKCVANKGCCHLPAIQWNLEHSCQRCCNQVCLDFSQSFYLQENV
jgi:hypothetical protein